MHQAELRSDSRILVVGHGPGKVPAATAVCPPDGYVIGVDPSQAIRSMAAERCASRGVADHVELREGSAELTHCSDKSMDAAISVNNTMLWDRRGVRRTPLGAQAGRTSRGHVHRHVLGVRSEQLRTDELAAGFVEVELTLRQRRFNSPAVELLAQRPDA